MNKSNETIVRKCGNCGAALLKSKLDSEQSSCSYCGIPILFPNALEEIKSCVTVEPGSLKHSPIRIVMG